MKNLFILAVCMFISDFCLAQSQGEESIYFANGKKIKGRIESADEDKISTVLENGAHLPGPRQRFILFFNKSGDFLTEKSLSKTPEKALKEIAAFYVLKADGVYNNDVLIRLAPREVVPCKITAVLEDAVNYVTLDGNSASINKENLVALIRSNGSHELLKEITIAASNLSAVSEDILKARTIKQPVPDPVVKPEVVPGVTQPVAEVSPEQKPATQEKKRLTSDEQKIYKAKSVDKMQDLASILNYLVDPKNSPAEKRAAVARAVEMFTDDAMIEVSAVNNPNDKSNSPVSKYLTRLSRLSYSKVKITYADIKFVEEFEPDQQGNFWGVATYSQTFSTNTFQDVTPKKQKIKLQPYKKIVDGAAEEKFRVLLGNISINVSE